MRRRLAGALEAARRKGRLSTVVIVWCAARESARQAFDVRLPQLVEPGTQMYVLLD